MHAPKEPTTPAENSRQLQRRLYLTAKTSPTRRFHALYDRVHRTDVLWRAWLEVKANKGAEGVDGITIEAIDRQGAREYVSRLQDDLRSGKYRPQAVKRVYIPKSDNSRRPLGIPTVKDRIVQSALKIVIEPIFEADFLDCSFGFRPKRNAHQALVQAKEAMVRNWQVVDADIKSFFDNLNHEILLKLLSRRISDRRVLKLIRLFLRSGILEDGVFSNTDEGTPQGGVISPLLANVYLHVLDVYWTKRYSRLGKLIRYADDFLIVCRYRRQMEEARVAVEHILKALKLSLNPDKTRAVDLNSEGVDFLGFHLCKRRSIRTGKVMPYIWPSQKSMKSMRGKIRELTERRWRCIGFGEVVGMLGPVIRGLRNYYALGNATHKLQQLDRYTRIRLWNFYRRKTGKRRNRSQALQNIRLLETKHPCAPFFEPGLAKRARLKAQGEGYRKAV